MFSDHIGILIESVEIHYGRFYYHSLGVKLVDCWMPVLVTGLPALATGENKILQIDSKWFEMCKKLQIFAHCQQLAVDYSYL